MKTAFIKGSLSIGLVAAVLLLLAPMSVRAEQYLKVTMQDIAVDVSPRSFIIPYKVLSAGSRETITVELLKDKRPVQSESLPSEGGTGEFRVSVDSDGTYVFRLRAMAGGDETAVSSLPVRIKVTTPQAARQSELRVTQLNEDGSVKLREGQVQADTTGPGTVGTQAASTSNLRLGWYLIPVLGITSVVLILAVLWRLLKPVRQEN